MRGGKDDAAAAQYLLVRFLPELSADLRHGVAATVLILQTPR
jgi:hypothetical protein